VRNQDFGSEGRLRPDIERPGRYNGRSGGGRGVRVRVIGVTVVAAATAEAAAG
jgi:hypothetical protein